MDGDSKPARGRQPRAPREPRGAAPRTDEQRLPLERTPGGLDTADSVRVSAKSTTKGVGALPHGPRCCWRAWEERSRRCCSSREDKLAPVASIPCCLRLLDAGDRLSAAARLARGRGGAGARLDCFGSVRSLPASQPTAAASAALLHRRASAVLETPALPCNALSQRRTDPPPISLSPAGALAYLAREGRTVKVIAGSAACINTALKARPRCALIPVC
jgi:hypothetical protein